MGLAEIAAGVETTTRQRDRGVAAVDATDGSLEERLDAFADDLPCSSGAAAAVVETYLGGASVGQSATAAGVVPVTAAKTLHLLGVEGMSPFSPVQRDVLRDWLSADLSRADALAITGASEEEFALAAFVATHDPVSGAAEVVSDDLAVESSMAEKRDRLSETMSDVGDLLS